MTITATARSMVILLVTVVAATLTVFASGTTSAQAATTTTTLERVRAMDPAVFEYRVQKWVNYQRTSRGMVPVKMQSCTDYYSERWGKYLATSMEFYHQDLSPFFSRCNARYAGETLARGAVSPRDIVRLWMNSPGHRAVILSKYPRRIGVGAYQDSRGDWVVAANFTRF